MQIYRGPITKGKDHLKYNLPSQYVPVLDEQGLPASLGSVRSGKNHKLRQLPAIHHHACNLERHVCLTKKTLFVNAAIHI